LERFCRTVVPGDATLVKQLLGRTAGLDQPPSQRGELVAILTSARTSRKSKSYSWKTFDRHQMRSLVLW
jgi:hypothetical protein